MQGISIFSVAQCFDQGKAGHARHEMIDQETPAAAQGFLPKKDLRVRVASNREAMALKQHPQRFPDTTVVVHNADYPLFQFSRPLPGDVSSPAGVGCI